MLETSDRADGLAISDSIEWSGAGLHFLLEDPTLAKAVSLGDCSELVRKHAIPPQMLDALAVFALDRNDLSDQLSGKKECDTRWLRALVREARKRNLIEDVPTANIEILVAPQDGLEVQHIRESAALLCPIWQEPRAEIARLWPEGVEFPAPKEVWFSLPQPLRGQGLLVSAWNTTTKEARFWLDGKTFEAHIESTPQRFSLSQRGLWIHCDSHQVLVGQEPIACSNTALPIVGDWLAYLSPSRYVAPRGYLSERIFWQHLDGKEPPRDFPWEHNVYRVACDKGALWITSDDGVWRADPDGVTQKFDREAFGICVDPLYIGHRTSVIARLEKWELGHLVFDIIPVKNGLVALGYSQWSWLDLRGNVRIRSADRRDVGFARLADGSFACSSGEEVLILDPEGELRARLMMPYDGQIVGATATHFIYGPISGGVARFTPDGVYAISASGEICDRNPDSTRPYRIQYAGGSVGDAGAIMPDGVLQVPRGSLTRWRPRPPSGKIHPLVNTNRSEAREVSSVKWETSNPRDDWPEPGLLVDAREQISIGCTYGGTTGVASSEAVIVDGGAVLVLERCKLVNGGGGKLRRGSTAILIDCELDAGFSAEPDCQLAILKSNSARSS